MRAKRATQMKRRECLTCVHPERARVDYLIAKGESIAAICKKFSLSKPSVYRHAREHISDQFRSVVKSSPLESLESLQKLAAEAGSSVVDNLVAIYGGLSNRWLQAFESGDDVKLGALTSKMQQNLELRARISREVLPSGSTFNQTNNFLLSDAGQLLKVLAPFPEARKAIVDFYNQKSAAPRVIEHVAASD